MLLPDFFLVNKDIYSVYNTVFIYILSGVRSNLYVRGPFFRRKTSEIFWGLCFPLFTMASISTEEALRLHNNTEQKLCIGFTQIIAKVRISTRIKLSVTMMATQ